MFWAWAGLPSQSLTFIDRGQASPAPQALTFIDRAWAGPVPQPLNSIGQPLSSIGRTPQIYQPDPHFY